MKSLALYIDKWFIIGAVCVDGNIRPVKLPNNEDRIWLFFHEDITNDSISYGKGFKSHYWNRENHYYGDIFAQLTNSSAKFTMFKHSQPIKDIFKMGKVFDDLKAAVDNVEDIHTYLCFSKDITPSARLIFRNELEQENFQIKESVARIDHLALEYAVKKNGFSDEGHYLVLNACNENLHYSIYKKSGDIFLRIAESELLGMGTDLRSRCLIEYIVDNINQTERFLKTPKEKETEYLRCSQFVEDWILKISNANLYIPVQITDVTLSKDPHKTYSVSVRRKQIDEKTEVIAKNLVDEIVRFVRENGIRHEEISSIIYLGNTFTNKQFTSQFLNHYNLRENRMICYMDKDLSMLVSAYTFIDCSQFNELETKFTANAEDELRRLKIAEEERIASENAKAEAEALAKTNQAKKEEEAKFRQAMDRGYESESNHDYEKMFEYFEIATKLRSEDKEATAKCEEARRLKAEQSVMLKTFKEKLQQAKSALDDKDWELAKQKAEEALSSNPESQEARHIKEDANRHITQQKDFDRYIDRADLFIAQKLYKEATEELEKARLLSIDDQVIKSKFEKIKELKSSFKTKIDNLTSLLDKSISNQDYNEAIRICNELREEDSTNQMKWSNKLSDVKTMQQKEKERIEKIRTLKGEIDEAKSSNDYERIIVLCTEALSINSDSLEFKSMLASAQQKKKEQKIVLLINKANTFAGNLELIHAINTIEEAIRLSPDDVVLSDIKRSFLERQSVILSKVESLSNQITEKESQFDYKEAIELCNQLTEIDTENKYKWSEMLQRLQSLQIEKSDLELNFRRKKADINVLIRNNDFKSAEKEIKLLLQRCHDFGITKYDKEFDELLQKSHTEKQDNPNYKDKAVKSLGQSEVKFPTKAPKETSIKDKTINDSPKKQSKLKDANDASTLGKEGLLLLQNKEFVQAKRYFALQKNNEMAQMCTNLIRLKKRYESRSITPEEEAELKTFYNKYKITL